MDYHQRINNAIDFIELNLQKKISLEAVSQEAFFSLYHFHRLFHGMIGFSIKEYIRKRRLSSAAHDLLCSSHSIIDIAFDYQYETPETFSRAFKKEYGVTPLKYRKQNKEVIHFEKINVLTLRNKIIKGDKPMEPKIISRSAFNIIGAALKTTSENGENFKEIPQFWDKCNRENTLSTIPNQSISDECYGICASAKLEEGKKNTLYSPSTNNGNSFAYIIAREVTNLDTIPNGMVGGVIPSAKYAVFSAKGIFPESIQNMVKHIYGTWLPNTSYEIGLTPDFELYRSDCRTDENGKNSGTCDIYIPLK